MRILVIGAGGVGSAVVPIAVRRAFFERMVVADYDADRAERAVARSPATTGSSPPGSTPRSPRTSPRCAASTRSPTSSTRSIRASSCRSSRARFAAGADYLDMAMSLSRPDPDAPHERTGVKLGDEQFARADAWAAAGRLALVGIGVEPGLSDVFARYAPTTCSARSTRSASATAPTSSSTATTSRRRSRSGRRSRSASTRRSSGRRTAAGTRRRRSASRRSSTSPRGSARSSASTSSTRRSCSIPRWVKARRVTFKYGLGDEFIGVLKTLHKLGLDRTDKVRVGGVGGLAARRGGRLPARIRRRSATGCTARPAPGPG